MKYNDFSDASFTYGYTGPVRKTPAGRLEARRSLKLLDIELAFAAFCSHVSEDQEILAGPFPPGMHDGFSVSVIPGSTGGNTDHWLGRLKLHCRCTDRSRLLELCGKLLNSLPLQDWLTVDSSLQGNAVTFCRITPLAPGIPSGINISGVTGHECELVFEADVCVTPPEPQLTD